MKEIKCPKCSTVFTIDEASYADILNQVKSEEFDSELDKRLAKEKELIETKLLQESNKKDSNYEKLISEKENELSKLQARIDNFESDKKLVINDTERRMQEKIIEKDKEINDLNNKISNLENSFESDKKISINDKEKEMTKIINNKDNEIKDLKNKLDNLVKDNELSLVMTSKAKENEITKLKTELKHQSDLKNLEIEKIKNSYKNENDSIKIEFDLALKQKDEEIAFYKDFKAKQSTKMVGESLEQHCENEFGKYYSMGLFKNAKFYKDNDVSDGTKGDYIYREYDEFGNELISIMFEMKNELDDSSNKKKNNIFFKKLDDDRKKKKCEYAILVSLLESDNELYNQGIVDVSNEYNKMYVIRPQFFIFIISLLRNAALNSLAYKQELDVIKQQNIDITNFEDKLNDFKEKFGKNYQSASKNFFNAIDEIDKSIKNLEKTKQYLITSENQLRLANDKADALKLERLVKDNETMKEKFNLNNKK